MNEEWKYHSAADEDLPPSERLRSERREVGLFGAASVGLCRFVSRTWLRLAHRLSVEAPAGLPEDPPFILMSNHTSHLDALSLAAILPARLTGKVFSLAAGDHFFDTPGKSRFAARVVNALPVWRKRGGSHALSHFRLRLSEKECGFILFPEGTRSRTGELGSFKAGIGMLVAGTDVPVYPCWIEGAARAWPAGAKLPRPGKVRVMVGKAMTFEKLPNDRSGWDSVAAQLREQVLALRPRPSAQECPPDR